MRCQSLGILAAALVAHARHQRAQGATVKSRDTAIPALHQSEPSAPVVIFGAAAHMSRMAEAMTRRAVLGSAVPPAILLVQGVDPLLPECHMVD